MEWTQLKAAERCWDLSSQKKALLAEQIYRTATEPKTFTLPPMRPALAVLAMVVLLFGLLLLWPKNNIEEEVVVLPGAADATTDEYVEKQEGDPTPDSQSQGVIPPKKEEESEEQKNPTSTEQKQEEPKEEELQNQSLSFAQAVETAKKKAFRQTFNNKLTKQEREALAIYLANENYLYLQGQEQGEITAFKESKPKQYILDIQIFTTQKAVGKDLTADAPLKLSQKEAALVKQDQKVLGTTELGVVRTFCPRVLKKEIKGAGEYLQNLSLESVTPKGRMRLQLKSQNPLTKSEVEELINHYINMDEVLWIELNYQTQEDTSNPTAIHRFWETEQEMPVEEADAIITEKILRRPEEKLSDRERMAFYKVHSVNVDVLVSHYENYSYTVPEFDMSITLITGSAYCGVDLQSSFQHALDLKEVEMRISSKITEAPSNVNIYYKLNEVSVASDAVPNLKILNEAFLITSMKNGGGVASVGLSLNQPDCAARGQTLKEFVKHCLSMECSSAISVKYAFLHMSKNDAVI